MFGIKKKKITSTDKLIRYAEMLKFGDIHIKMDEATGLKAIVAIHDTRLGPAIGGCRCLDYPSMEDAFIDVLRLAQMMSYKAAICGLNHGGAKAVIMRPAEGIKDKVAFFQSFGDFVNNLGGRYITAVDSGTESSDMDIVATRTSYVTSTTQKYGDPSIYTALGVRRGIEAALKFKLNKESLEAAHIAIQGVGHVGYFLAKELANLGAKLTITDKDPQTVERIADEFKADVVKPEKIYSVECDVFAPCALGAVLNASTIPQLKAPIVAGSANNQLAEPKFAQTLHERGILYAPDFVINSGGLIHVSVIYDHGDETKAHAQIYDLYHTLFDIFVRSKRENRPTNQIAESIALENLQKKR